MYYFKLKAYVKLWCKNNVNKQKNKKTLLFYYAKKNRLKLLIVHICNIFSLWTLLDILYCINIRKL